MRYGWPLDFRPHLTGRSCRDHCTGRAGDRQSPIPVSSPFLTFPQSTASGTASARPPAQPARQFLIRRARPNTGEVIGVFGDVVIPPGPGMTGLPSSVETKNLDRLEVELRKLEPPVWPASFGAPDQARVDAGKTLFEQKGCIGCHQIEAPGTSIYQVKMVPLTRDSQGNDNRNNTDPWMACNAISYRGSSGKLKGKKEAMFRAGSRRRSSRFADLALHTRQRGAVASGRPPFVDAKHLFGVERLPRVISGAAHPKRGARRASRKLRREHSPLFAYKARPADGIWGDCALSPQRLGTDALRSAARAGSAADQLRRRRPRI